MTRDFKGPLPFSLRDAIENALFDATGKLSEGKNPAAVVEDHIKEFIYVNLSLFYRTVEDPSSALVLRYLAKRFGIEEDLRS